jgi:hypothetical protein
MPVREFANQKSLIDYAERNGLVYLWERMPAFARRQRMVSPLPAFTKRQQMLSPDQYEIVDVRTSRGGVRRAMLGDLASGVGGQCAAARKDGDQARAHGGEAGGEAKAIAIMKNGAALLLGGSRPKGDATDQCCRNLSIEMSATNTV